MLKRIRVLEDGRIPAKKARNWKIEGQKRRITRKKQRRLWNEFETVGFVARKGLSNVARERMLQDRGALPKEEGDVHEDNFFCNWLREDLEGTEERRKDTEKKGREEESRSGKRKVKRRGENGDQEMECESDFHRCF